MYLANLASGHTHDEASLLVNQDNDLEEVITHLFNEVNTFIIKFEKNKTKKTQPIRI